MGTGRAAAEVNPVLPGNPKTGICKYMDEMEISGGQVYVLDHSYTHTYIHMYRCVYIYTHVCISAYMYIDVCKMHK